MKPGPEAQKRFTEALERLVLKHPTFAVEMPMGNIIVLVAQMQLALRHPRNNGDSAKTCRDFCEQVIAEIARAEPELAEILTWGFDPSKDIP